MKVTVVPAQVTTVEDRIAGNLGFSQLLLLATPIFAGGLLFMLLPPPMHNAPYKIVAISILTFMCWSSAIRIKGKILLFWLAIILRYNLRPGYYVFNKNSEASREQYRELLIKEPTADKVKATAKQIVPSRLELADKVRTLNLINNPAAKVHFETDKKGKLYVRITEVKEQS
ncbi:PrgI family protein [Candidatus Dojkabacteria bacterium]|uniref:PrgI family protein n=1 Tax=Candidatus Dojkabacteria bacterium TaxID=2099670 RepID=A0A5C7J316_9BACT|nr:MAG: PrgI family protein [Candidatus Dojkabacteria bacterium]